MKEALDEQGRHKIYYDYKANEKFHIYQETSSLFFLPPYFSPWSKLILLLRSPKTEFKVSAKSQFKGYVLFAIFNPVNHSLVLQTFLNSLFQNSYPNNSCMAVVSIFSFRVIFSTYIRVIIQLNWISLL